MPSVPFRFLSSIGNITALTNIDFGTVLLAVSWPISHQGKHASGIDINRIDAESIRTYSRHCYASIYMIYLHVSCSSVLD